MRTKKIIIILVIALFLAVVLACLAAAQTPASPSLPWTDPDPVAPTPPAPTPPTTPPVTLPPCPCECKGGAYTVPGTATCTGRLCEACTSKRDGGTVTLQEGYYLVDERASTNLKMRGKKPLPPGTLFHYDRDRDRIDAYYYKDDRGNWVQVSITGTHITINGEEYTVWTSLTGNTRVKKIIKRIASTEELPGAPTPGTPPGGEAPAAPPPSAETPTATITSEPVFRVDVNEKEKKDGRLDCFTAADGKDKKCYLVATDGTYYEQDPKEKGKYTKIEEINYTDAADKALGDVCNTGTNEEKKKCREEKMAEMNTHKEFAAFIAEQRKFTFQEGIELGSNLWGLGVKFKLWSEADNPMSQLNDFFTNTKTGLWLSGNWEKSICWETTDFNRPTDGVAFVPGTENVGAWVAGDYVEYTHPVLGNPSATTTEYIYRITSYVNPAGLTINSGSKNCMDVMQFQYTLDGRAIDLDMDGKTSDDVVKIACDSKPYALTEQNALVRVSNKLYGQVCIAFQPMFLKSAFYSNLDAGRLCAPIVPAGYEYGTGCQWCPGIFTAPIGTGGVGYGSGGAFYAGTPQENRPGVNNPATASG